MRILHAYGDQITLTRLTDFGTVSREFSFTPTRTALCLDNTTQLRWENLQGIEVRHDQALAEIFLGSGHRETVPTETSAFLSLDDNLLFTNCTAEEALNKGVFVPVAVQMPDSPHVLQMIWNDNNIRLKGELLLDYYFGNLLGVAMNNIRVAGNRIEVPLNHPDLASMFEDNLCDLYKDSVELKGARGEQNYWMECTELSRKFVEWIGDARPHWLPSFLLSAQNEFRRGFFVGLLENSGTVCGGKQLYADSATTLPYVAQKLYWLAASLGVRATIQYSDQVYRVRFRSVPVTITRDMVNKWRSKHLEVCVTDPADGDSIPISITLAQAIMKLVGRNRHSLQESFRASAKKGYISRGKAREVLRLFQPEVQAIEGGNLWTNLVGNTSIAWSRIESISPAHSATIGVPVFAPEIVGWTTASGIVLANCHC